MGWVTPFAPTDAELSSCVHCGLCLPHCPTFRLTGKETESPRGRLTAMRAIADGVAVIDDAFEEIVDSCLQCRACEVVCPSMVPFGRAMEGTRAEVSAQHPRPSRRLRHLVLGSLIRRRGLVRAAGLMGRAARRMPALVPGRLRAGLAGLRADAGRRTTPSGVSSPGDAPMGTVALLTGCVMDSWFAGVHEATVAVLSAAGYAVVSPEGQTCCGALAAHDGAAVAAADMAAVNGQAFAGYDYIVADAAGCAAHLKDYGHWDVEAGDSVAARTREVTELVVAAIDAGRLPVSDGRGVRVAVHDPCHNRNAQRITAEPRRVLSSAGYELIDVDPAGMCCGAAGAYSLLRPGTASELGRAKAEEVAATGAQIVASANPGCEMQLRAHVGAGVRVAHPIELYWEWLSTVTGRALV